MQQQRQLSISSSYVNLLGKMIQRALQDKFMSSFQEYSICLSLTSGPMSESLVSLMLSVPDSIFPTISDAIKWRLAVYMRVCNMDAIIDLVVQSSTPFDDWYIMETYTRACLYANDSIETAIFWSSPSYIEAHPDALNTITQQRIRALSELQLVFFSSCPCQALCIKYLIKYFEEFCKKEICFSDLIPYFTQISSLDVALGKNVQIEFCQYLIEFISNSHILVDGDSSLPGRYDLIEKVLTACKILVFFKHTGALPMHEYYEALYRYGSIEQKTGILMLQMNSLLDRESNSYSKVNLEKAALILIRAIQKEGLFNYAPMKLLLISILRELRGTNLALVYFNSLDLKHIQLDILSYLILDWISVIGYPDWIMDHIDNMMDLYDSNEHETPNMILVAWKNSAFSSLPDFLDFYLQLKYSIQKHIMNVIKIQTRLIQFKTLDTVRQFIIHDKGLLLILEDIRCKGEHVISDHRPIGELYSSWWSFDPIRMFVQRNEPKGPKWLELCQTVLITMHRVFHWRGVNDENDVDIHGKMISDIEFLLEEIMSNECASLELPGIVSLFSLTRIISSSMVKFKDQHGFDDILTALQHTKRNLADLVNASTTMRDASNTPDKIFESLDVFAEIVHYVTLYCIGFVQGGFISYEYKNRTDDLMLFASFVKDMSSFLGNPSINGWIKSFSSGDVCDLGDDTICYLESNVSLRHALMEDWAVLVERVRSMIQNCEYMLRGLYNTIASHIPINGE